MGGACGLGQLHLQMLVEHVTSPPPTPVVKNRRSFLFPGELGKQEPA